VAAATTFVGSTLPILHIVLLKSNDEWRGNEREIYCIARWRRQQDHGCDNNIAACTIVTTYNIALHGGDDDNALRDGNDLSYCVVRWQRLIHCVARWQRNNEVAAATTFVIRQPLIHYNVSHKSDDYNASRDCDDFDATYHIASHDGDNDNASTASHVISPHAMAVTMMTMRYKGSNTTAAVDEEVTCYTSSIDATINY
jgi:hypothetical protein